MNSVMRLFVGIELDEAFRDALKYLQDDMIDGGLEGIPAPKENLHLTLAFIGEYGNPDEVMDALEEVPFEPFEIKLSGIGSFRDLYWAGIAENEDLETLAARIRRSLALHDIPFDRKSFHPHITLLRKAFFRNPEAGLPQIIPDVKMTVEHFTLFRSERGKNGMIYTAIGELE